MSDVVRLIPPLRTRSLAEKVVQAIVIALITAAVLGVAYVLRFLLLPIVSAMLLTYVLGPIADTIENRGAKRSTAVGACIALLLGGFAAVGVGVWPSLEAWLRERPVGEEESVFEVQLHARLSEWQTWLTAHYPKVNWPSLVGKAQHFLETQQRTLVEGLPSMALSVASHAGSVVLALVIAVFVLIDGANMKKAFVAMVPNRHFENAMVMLDRVDRQISSYLIGTAAENALVTVLVAIPLYALGMPNALLFAVLFGVANVIPFAGPFIGAAAGLLFCMLDPNAPSMGLVALVYVVVHFVDAGVINPWVMGKSLDMHPLTVIVGIAVGGSLGGVVGMLAIIPSIAVVKAMVTTVVEGLQNAATE